MLVFFAVAVLAALIVLACCKVASDSDRHMEKILKQKPAQKEAAEKDSESR